MSTGKILLGVLAGVAAGALIGVLLAPDKGSDTRKNMGRKSDDFVDGLKGKLDDFLNGVSEKFNKAKDDANEFAEVHMAHHSEAKNK